MTIPYTVPGDTLCNQFKDSSENYDCIENRYGIFFYLFSVNPFPVDIYALGVIMHRCLLGTFPNFASPTTAKLCSLVPQVIPMARHDRQHNISSNQCFETKPEVTVPENMLEAMNTLRTCLSGNPSMRPGPFAISNAKWIQDAMKQRHTLPFSAFFF
ncbi:hypothetical protein Ddc_22442 [Ditylenchus destructor]|nr:hypothetical protein Ddc_22442 [Ditylenchus destructor]